MPKRAGYNAVEFGYVNSVARTFQPPPLISVRLRGAAAPRDARRVIRGLLMGTSHADWHADAELVISELVANAIAACGECEVSAWYLGDERALRVEVIDSSAQLPVPQPASSNRVGGHGLRIVDRLAHRWGVAEHSGTKTVWFEIDG